MNPRLCNLPQELEIVRSRRNYETEQGGFSMASGRLRLHHLAACAARRLQRLVARTITRGHRRVARPRPRRPGGRPRPGVSYLEATHRGEVDRREPPRRRGGARGAHRRRRRRRRALHGACARRGSTRPAGRHDYRDRRRSRHAPASAVRRHARPSSACSASDPPTTAHAVSGDRGGNHNRLANTWVDQFKATFPRRQSSHLRTQRNGGQNHFRKLIAGGEVAGREAVERNHPSTSR